MMEVLSAESSESVILPKGPSHADNTRYVVENQESVYFRGISHWFSTDDGTPGGFSHGLHNSPSGVSARVNGAAYLTKSLPLRYWVNGETRIIENRRAGRDTRG